jgi:E3 ubiquitin-protein ligase DOA10
VSLRTLVLKVEVFIDVLCILRLYDALWQPSEICDNSQATDSSISINCTVLIVFFTLLLLLSNHGTNVIEIKFWSQMVKFFLPHCI